MPIDPNKHVCSFCGMPAHALAANVDGLTAVRTCYRCAVETIPVLIADAVLASGGPGGESFEQARFGCERARASYWLAVARRSLRPR